MTTANEKKETEVVIEKEAVAEPRKTAKTVAIKNLDFGDLKPVWNKMLDSNRPDAETGLLKVTARVGSLDPLAQQALAKMRKKFPYTSSNVRRIIASRGITSELDRVLKRLNGLRISENKRLVLAAVYPALLAGLLEGDDLSLEEIKDDKGFVNAILFELERKDGPLDVFSQELVKLVGAKHRINITEDNVLRDLIAHQVRVSL